jgi:hypothetical protein
MPMPRTVERLRQIEEYAFNRWTTPTHHASLDMWWNAAYLAGYYLNYPQDARYVIPQNKDVADGPSRPTEDVPGAMASREVLQEATGDHILSDG